MVPAAVCASFAFMLPVAGPSNAIVFATGRITILDMVWHWASIPNDQYYMLSWSPDLSKKILS